MRLWFAIMPARRRGRTSAYLRLAPRSRCTTTRHDAPAKSIESAWVVA
jgi:hypothetical protein